MHDQPWCEYADEHGACSLTAGHDGDHTAIPDDETYALIVLPDDETYALIVLAAILPACSDPECDVCPLFP